MRRPGWRSKTRSRPDFQILARAQEFHRQELSSISEIGVSCPSKIGDNDLAATRERAMGTYVLSKAELHLCRKTQHGDKAKFKTRGRKYIRAAILRHIVVGLPVVTRQGGLRTAIASFFDADATEVRWPVTGVGISISDAVIKGHLNLDSAIGKDGGPIWPLAFERCHFKGGFSGANAHFARLGFKDCTFSWSAEDMEEDPEEDPDEDPEGDGEQLAKRDSGTATPEHSAGTGPGALCQSDNRPRGPVPSLDLSGARVDGDLDLTGIRPHGSEHLLWIRAPGIQVDGEVDLSRCHLRAPTSETSPLICEDAEDALDMALAEIKGDVKFLCGGRIEGQVRLRGAHIAGDLWLRGATILNGRRRALFLQGARIDGFLAMDGGWDRAQVGKEAADERDAGETRSDKPERGAEEAETADEQKPNCYRSFRCAGGLDLRAAEIGHDLYLRNAVVQGAINAPDLFVGKDFLLGAEARGKIDISGCRIGGSLDVSELDLSSTAKDVVLTDGNIARSFGLVRFQRHYRLVKARMTGLRSMPALDLVETLWALAPAEKQPGDDPEKIPLCERLVQAAFLIHRDRRIFHLDGHAGALRRAAARFGIRIDNGAKAAEFTRLYGAYVLGERGAFRAIARLDDPALARDRNRPEITPLWRKLVEDHRPAAETSKAGEGENAARRSYRVTAIGIHDDRLRACDSVLLVEPNQVTISRNIAGIDDEVSLLGGAPRFRNGFLLPPTVPDKDLKAIVGAEEWLAGPVIGMKAVQCSARMRKVLESVLGARGVRVADALGRRRERALERKLVYFLQPRPVLQARFNLEGLACDMLDDQAGRAWRGHHDTIRMNHFLYHRTTWEPDTVPRKPGRFAKPVKGFMKRIPRIVEYAVLNVIDYFRNFRGIKNFRRWWRRSGADYTPVSAAWFFGLNDFFKFGPHWTPVQRKRNWIYRQFDTSGLSSSSKYRIQREEYRSQPFEQAIKVARTEGREDYATYFEILKHRIEWSIFIDSNAQVFFWLGLVAGTAWLAVSWEAPPFGLGPGALWTGAVLLFLTPMLLPRAANSFMRLGFGYLRRPINAIFTLVVAFLIGWAGVYAANYNGMLVIDVAPVANVAGETEQRIRIGSTRGDVVIRNVHCDDDINQALYALDVLIPLIDLRQESRCAVERAEAFSNPEVRDRVQGRSPPPGAVDREEAFWNVMKALYAIAGWFIVSLAILTFVHVARTRSEAS